jgi:hypothetical protein
MYRRDDESHKYVDKDNIYMSVSDVEINTEIDLRVYTGNTVCKPAYTLFIQYCILPKVVTGVKNKIA